MKLLYLNHLGFNPQLILTMVKKGCKMTVFISGKITNNPNYQEEFANAENIINGYVGLVALNPAILPKGLNNRDYMQIGFQMIDNSDAMFMLPNWKDSEGAKIEHMYAKYLNMPIFYSEDEMFAWATNYATDSYTDDFSTLFFDEEEIHENCTVEIWKNSATGECSVGWKPNTEWISLTDDNIPDDEVLAYSTKADEQMLGHIFWDNDTKSYYCDLGGYILEDITHWRELPKPPC